MDIFVDKVKKLILVSHGVIGGPVGSNRLIRITTEQIGDFALQEYKMVDLSEWCLFDPEHESVVEDPNNKGFLSFNDASAAEYAKKQLGSKIELQVMRVEDVFHYIRGDRSHE